MPQSEERRFEVTAVGIGPGPGGMREKKVKLLVSGTQSTLISATGSLAEADTVVNWCRLRAARHRLPAMTSSFAHGVPATLRGSKTGRCLGRHAP